MTPQRFLLLSSVLLALAAVPALDAAGIDGKWILVWDTEGGVRRTEWKIVQDGQDLTVETNGQVFEGTLKGDQIVVEGELYSGEAGYSATLKIEGTFKGEELRGKGTWDQYAMTFTGKRAE